MNTQILFYIISILYLIVCTVFDIKSMELPRLFLIISSIGSFLLSILFHEFQAVSFIISISLLTFLYLIFRKREEIGKGDLFIMSFLLFMFGISKGLVLLTLSFLLAGVFGLITALIKRERMKEKRVPFSPFVLVATLFLFLVEFIC